MRRVPFRSLPPIDLDSSSRCHIRITRCVDEGQKEVLLVDEIDFSFIVKRLGRGTEKWERIREGVNPLNGWMKGLGHSGYVG